jgi:hypothetical protein
MEPAPGRTDLEGWPRPGLRGRARARERARSRSMAGHEHRLEQVGLALTVVAREHVEPLARLQREWTQLADPTGYEWARRRASESGHDRRTCTRGTGDRCLQVVAGTSRRGQRPPPCGGRSDARAGAPGGASPVRRLDRGSLRRCGRRSATTCPRLPPEQLIGGASPCASRSSLEQALPNVLPHMCATLAQGDPGPGPIEEPRHVSGIGASDRRAPGFRGPRRVGICHGAGPGTRDDAAGHHRSTR